MPLFDEQGERIRGKENRQAAEIALAREKLTWEGKPSGGNAGGFAFESSWKQIACSHSPGYRGGMSEVTQILTAIERGDPQAAEKLLPLVYEELRKLAAAKLASEKPGQTLQATALVHEAYLRLVGVEMPQCWDSQGHFFAAAAESMRRILVENARRKQTEKAGGDYRRIELDNVEPLTAAPNLDLLALDEALHKLAARNPRHAEVVKLRFFGGLSIEKVARILGVSTSTIENDWAYARSWLRVEMAGGDHSKPQT